MNNEKKPYFTHVSEIYHQGANLKKLNTKFKYCQILIDVELVCHQK